MKKFFKKNYGYFIVGGLILLFILFSLFVDDKTGAPTPDATVTQWVEETKKDKYIATVIGSTTCPHCSNYKPVFEKVVADNNIENYWFYGDQLTSTDSQTLTTIYQLEQFDGGVPYTFVTKNGEFIADIVGEMDANTLTQFFKDNEIIK